MTIIPEPNWYVQDYSVIHSVPVHINIVVFVVESFHKCENYTRVLVPTLTVSDRIYAVALEQQNRLVYGYYLACSTVILTFNYGLFKFFYLGV